VQSEALLGWAQMLQAKYDDALMSFQKVLMKEPANSLARINVGYICLKKKIFGEAIEHLSKAIRLDNDRKAVLYAHFYLGLVYLEREMYEDAQTFFRKTIGLGPNLIEAYYELGRAHWFNEERDEARQTWQQGSRPTSSTRGGSGARDAPAGGVRGRAAAGGVRRARARAALAGAALAAAMAARRPAARPGHVRAPRRRPAPRRGPLHHRRVPVRGRLARSLLQEAVLRATPSRDSRGSPHGGDRAGPGRADIPGAGGGGRPRVGGGDRVPRVAADRDAGARRRRGRGPARDAAPRTRAPRPAEVLGGSVPRWFDEGYASYAAGEWGREQVLATSLGLVWRGIPTLAGLDSGLLPRVGNGAALVRAGAPGGGGARVARPGAGAHPAVRALATAGVVRAGAPVPMA
jgi:hypothetical protein